MEEKLFEALEARHNDEIHRQRSDMVTLREDLDAQAARNEALACENRRLWASLGYLRQAYGVLWSAADADNAGEIDEANGLAEKADDIIAGLVALEAGK